MIGDTAVGCRMMDATAVDTPEPVPVLAMYPARGAGTPVPFGPYTLHVAVDGTPVEGTFPLVVISHGSGGSPLTHRLLAAHLARAGFVVLLPEHPGNNRRDNSLAGTATVLAARPRHVSAAIDRAQTNTMLGPRLQGGGVALIGHSLGGYTGLALAGGRPTALPGEFTPGADPAVAVVPDPRIRALVLLAPATAWFMRTGALSDVRVPILMLTAEHDAQTPAGHAGIVIDGLPRPTALSHRVVPNAGHYSFLSEFPPSMCGTAFPPSQDPAGFDRAQFLAGMYEEVEIFLRQTIRAP